MDWLKPIIENGEKVGVVTILLLGFAALLAGLISGHVLIGPAAKEGKTALKEANEALKVANAELKRVETDYIRLQVEKDLLWQNWMNQQPRPRSMPVIKPRRKR